MHLTLVSHHLCPYVQRAAISLAEKQVDFDRVYIDLANKPDWFLALSPLGKVPVLKDRDQAIFESAAILEYLEDTLPRPLHPGDALMRARHRAWIEFGSSVLNDIGAFYAAADETGLAKAAERLRGKFRRLEAEMAGGPWFAGDDFSLVDAVFGPVFRYFDVFDRIAAFGILDDLPRVAAWRGALAARPSVRQAVDPDYAERLLVFFRQRGSYLSGMIAAAGRQIQPAA